MFSKQFFRCCQARRGFNHSLRNNVVAASFRKTDKLDRSVFVARPSINFFAPRCLFFTYGLNPMKKIQACSFKGLVAKERELASQASWQGPTFFSLSLGHKVIGKVLESFSQHNFMTMYFQLKEINTFVVIS